MEGLAIHIYQKLTTYAKDLTLSRICSKQVDVRDGMILLKVKPKMFFQTSAINFFLQLPKQRLRTIAVLLNLKIIICLCILHNSNRKDREEVYFYNT